MSPEDTAKGWTAQAAGAVLLPGAACAPGRALRSPRPCRGVRSEGEGSALGTNHPEVGSELRGAWAAFGRGTGDTGAPSRCLQSTPTGGPLPPAAAVRVAL